AEIQHVRLDGASIEVRRRRVDEVLHGVRCDDVAVVALGICRAETFAEDVDRDRRRERRGGALRPPEEDDARRGVLDLPAHRARATGCGALARTPSSPVGSWPSRVCGSRARMTGTISSFERPATKTTN